MRKWLLSVLLVLCVLPVTAQTLPHVLIRVKMPSGLTAERVPVLATLNLAEVRAALKLSATPASGLVQALEGANTVPAQFDVVSASEAQVCLLLPTQPAGQRLVKLYLTRPAAAATAGPSPVTVQQAGAVVTLDTGAVALTFDPAKNGGLPSKIVFTKGNKTWDNVTLNDRVYEPQLKGFRLGDDKQPVVRLTANGPLYTEVRVSARYMQGEKPAPSGASATYNFSFVSGSPTFRVSADIRQQDAFDWKELHFLELYFHDNTFPEWAAGPPGEKNAFKDEGKGDHGAKWGALIDGQNAIGLLTSAMIYDGNKDYGRYVHGPWLAWGDTQAHFAADIWAGTTADPVAVIDAAAASGARVLDGMMLTPGLVAGLEKLRKARAQQAWLAALLEKAVAEGRMGLGEAEKTTARLASPVKTPAVDGLKLTLLDNQQLGLAFRRDRAGIQLVSLFDLQRRREILAAPGDLFQIALLEAGGRRSSLMSGSGWGRTTWTADRGGLNTLVFTEPLDKALQGLSATLRVRLDGNLSFWKLEVGNRSKQWSVDKVTLPSLKVAALGDDAGDDLVLFPNGYGRGFPVTSGVVMGGLYPSGGCVMQWLGACDDTSGVYVAQHDPTASTKTLYSSCGGEGAYSGLRIEVPAENATVPGNAYHQQGEVVVGVTGSGGWWPMTRIYRSFLDKSAPWWPEPGKYSRSDYPKWVQDTQTWVCHGAGTAKGTVAPTKAFAEAMGTPTALHWYNWHQIPFDNQYPHYFPTKDGFRDGVAELQKAGVRVMPYINGRLFDKDMDDFRNEAVKYATKKANGEVYIERYGSGRDLVPMCVSQPFWQDKINEIVMKLVGEEGVDGVYIDQIGAAGAVLCYDKSHGHPLAGGHWWVDGYWKMLGPLQQKIAKISPDKMLTTESNAEPYAKYLDAYLMCNDNSDYDLPLFPAVYGGKILMFGTYMNNKDWDDLTLMALRQGKLFAFGTQLWWSDPGIVRNAQATQWLRDVAHLRQQVNEFFVHGQMAAPPRFSEKIGALATGWRAWGPNEQTITTPDLWATTWRLQSGQLLMPLVNLPKAERTFTLQFDPATYGLKTTARVKIERLSSAGVVETVTRQGKFALPVKLGPAEATALRITGQ